MNSFWLFYKKYTPEEIKNYIEQLILKNDLHIIGSQLHIFSQNPFLLSLNTFKEIQNYTFINEDEVKFILENKDKKFDHIILDLPVFFSHIKDEIKWYWLERFFTREFFVWNLFSLIIIWNRIYFIM